MSGLSGRGVSVGDRVVYQGAFASRPTSAVAYDEAIFTDVGVSGTKWFWDGSTWKPVNGQCLIYTNKYPILIATTGTINVGSTGTLTLGTAQEYVMSSGAWVYLPNVASTPAITAGFYFCIFSSTTVGTLYGSSQSLPNDTPSTTALTISGGLAFTGSTSEITFASVSLPAGALPVGANVGIVTNTVKNSGTSSLTIRHKINGNNTYQNSSAVNTNRSSRIAVDNIISSSTLAVNYTLQGFFGTSTQVVSTMVIDNTTAQAVALTYQTGTATDSCIMTKSEWILRI